jgi:hypothetical protein
MTRTLSVTLTVLALIAFSGAFARSDGDSQFSGPMIREGWTSPMNRKLRPVADPASRATVNVDPLRREAGSRPDGGRTDVVVLHFVEATAVFEKSYDNARALAILDRTFYDMALLEGMEYVTVTGAASPEGGTAANEKLAASRALAIKEYIVRRFPYIDRDRIATFSAGEDWNGLKRMIEDDPHTPGREEALRLLRSPLQGDMLRARLREIAGGTTYKYISEHMFPVLRGGAACMIYFREDFKAPQSQPVPPPPPAPPAEEPEPAVETPDIAAAQPAEELPPLETHHRYKDPLLWAVKTNLLYDATATINLGVEFRLSDRTSLDIPVNYNGWTFSDNRKWKHYLIQPELRWWPRGTFRGHFWGVHGHFARYNVGGLPDPPFPKVVHTHRLDGRLAGAGLSYGYRWNFDRRWAMEATIGAGYAYLSHDKYPCDPCGEKIGTGEKHWFGPTKAGISLIRSFGHTIK